MIELTFQAFHDQKYSKQQFCLYLVKNGDNSVLYVGISTNDVWERWFGWGGHMTWDGKVIYGESPIGVKIENHLPDSLRWNFQLWTLEDCVEFCKEELPGDRSKATIREIEPIMIRKLSPSLNLTYNYAPGIDTTPKSENEKELAQKSDSAYDEIFNQEE
jgi:hypothetical protein